MTDKQDPPTTPPLLITAHEAGRHLGVSTHVVLRLARQAGVELHVRGKTDGPKKHYSIAVDQLGRLREAHQAEVALGELRQLPQRQANAAKAREAITRNVNMQIVYAEILTVHEEIQQVSGQQVAIREVVNQLAINVDKALTNMHKAERALDAALHAVNKVAADLDQSNQVTRFPRGGVK